MEKQQVHAKPAFIKSQAALAANEGEIAAQFKQEVFQPVDQRVFQL